MSSTFRNIESFIEIPKTLFFVNFGDGNWRQAKALIVLLAGAIEVNALAQGALRQFTQWLWIEDPIFQLRGGNRLRIFKIQYNLLLSVDEIIQIFRIYWKPKV